MDATNTKMETLHTYLLRNGTVSLDDGVELAVRVLSVLDYCHGRRMPHCNLTPQRIVVSDSQPVLIDYSFPINGHNNGASSSLSSFLELPEYQISLDLARRDDTVSDLTAVAGILLYAMTGVIPGQLKDADGRMPHQRQEVRAILDQISGYRSFLLNQIFDRAFQWQPQERYQTASELSEDLSRLRDYAPSTSPATSLDDIVSGLRSGTQSQTVTPHEMRLQTAFNGLRTVFAELAQSLEADFREMEAGYRKELGKPIYSAFMKFNYRLAPETGLKLTFRLEIVGSEIVVSGAVETSDDAHVEELFRADHHGFLDSSGLEKEVRQFVATNLSLLLVDVD